MKDDLTRVLIDAAKKTGISDPKISLEYPENPDHGDFSTNVALAYAKPLKMSPKVLAEKIVAEMRKSMPDFVESVEIAGAGFINIKIKDAVLAEIAIKPRISAKKTSNKVMVEYTDPNPFKAFHIGHLMSNAIGESISRLIEHTGVEVIRACYQGDVGMHVAKTVWGIMNDTKAGDLVQVRNADLSRKIDFLGLAYAMGNSAYEGDESFVKIGVGKSQVEVKKEIESINKKIFDRSDSKINEIYKEGRQWSLDYFDLIYKRLGTDFKEFFFESEVADKGLEVVNEFLKKDVFEKSDGAVVFKGEKYGLHTRVFINSQDLPTYEAKEIGLNIEKFRKYPDLTESIIITGNEINEYFKVLKKVLSLVAPNVAGKTKHLSHGMMRLSDGKMSSRTGNVVTADSLIGDMKSMALEKMTGREFDKKDADEIAEQIAVAAIKYTVLRSSVGSDIIFDSVASISFEGDSGPYLQYSAVRARSVLEKAKGIELSKIAIPEAFQVGLLERLLVRFPDVAARAAVEFSPQQVAGYLITLAGSFNGFYNATVIIDEKDPLTPYRLALTRAFLVTMTEGLWLLGIKVPKKM